MHELHSMSAGSCRRLGFGWLVSALVVLLSFSVLATPGMAQDDEFIPEEESVDDQEAKTDFSKIDELLARDEEALVTPENLSYDSEGRRDPFRSLVQQRQQRRVVETPEERPEGVAGLLIDEIEVEGVFILPEGPVAQIQSPSEQTSFLLRPGDQLWDGDVLEITLQEIIFKQTVNDPTALKPFREVVKQLD